MTTATPEQLFEAEVKQADIDHHTPTAGAMTGHIVSNLVVLSDKLQMAKWYVKGMQAEQLKDLFGKLLHQAYAQKDALGAVLIDEALVTPSTQKNLANTPCSKKMVKTSMNLQNGSLTTWFMIMILRTCLSPVPSNWRTKKTVQFWLSI